MSSAFSPAFLRGEARALAFLPDDFRHASRRAEHVRRAGTRSVSPRTLEVLRAQQAPGREAQLDALARPGTVVVVTGQQVGLFLGPLYSLYKAATAVSVARALEQETGVRCVPVFWLQSEDHDFEEIDHCHVHARDGALVKLRLPAPHHVERCSLSGLALGAGVDEALRRLSEALEGLPHADEVLALFSRHYRPERTWVSAFADVMAELLPELLVLDPRDPALAAEALVVHRRAVEEAPAIARALLERHAALEREGFATQVHVRPDAPLCFFHPQGREGPRYRLEPRDGRWGLVGGTETFSTEQLLAGCFSSSALLRPLVQDTLLPTAAYVGGPGEANYFAQLAPLYAHFGKPMPMFVPRARFRVVEPRVRSVLGELGLGPADVEAPTEAVLKKLLPPPANPSPEELERRINEAVAPLLDAVTGVDDAVKRTRATIARAASRLAGRHARARLRSDEVLIGRVERAQRALWPHGEPQERVLGFPGFAARFGVQGFVELVKQALVPFEVDVKDVNP
jgi:bacillithiol biosynthesis cysteine-adding enzyme BshC